MSMIDPKKIAEWKAWAEGGERDDPPPPGDVLDILSERESLLSLLREVDAVLSGDSSAGGHSTDPGDKSCDGCRLRVRLAAFLKE